MKVRKKVASALLCAVLVVPLVSVTRADSSLQVTRIDVVTQQGNGTFHPQQIAVERSLASETKTSERIRMPPLRKIP